MSACEWQILLQQDAYINERATFDPCLGHSAPNGAYHYHSEVPSGARAPPASSRARWPAAATAASSRASWPPPRSPRRPQRLTSWARPAAAAAAAGCIYTAVAGQHSPLFSVMADGIPIYGPKGDGGVAPTDLDECGGHTDAAHPFYHYHVADGFRSPYVIKCLSGCVFHNWGNRNLDRHVKTAATCQQAATQYDYSSLRINWL